jgi:hypothetical protein
MSDKIEYSRLLIKRSDISGVTPTITSATTLNDFTETDLFSGEMFLNTADETAYVRLGNTLKQFDLITSGGTEDLPFLPLTGGTMTGDITMSSSTTVYVDNLNINTIGVGTSLNNLGIDASGNVVTGTDTNFSNTDLTFTGNRAHNTNGNQLSIASDGVFEEYLFIGSGKSMLWFFKGGFWVDTNGPKIVSEASTLKLEQGAGGMYKSIIDFSAATQNNTYFLPNTSGTVALLSDIPTVDSVYLPLTGGTMTGDITMDTTTTVKSSSNSGSTLNLNYGGNSNTVGLQTESGTITDNLILDPDINTDFGTGISSYDSGSDEVCSLSTSPTNGTFNVFDYNQSEYSGKLYILRDTSLGNDKISAQLTTQDDNLATVSTLCSLSMVTDRNTQQGNVDMVAGYNMELKGLNMLDIVSDDIRLSPIGLSGTISLSADTTVTGDLNITVDKGISFGSGASIIFVELEIGDWNMDTTTGVNVAHSLSATEWKTVRNINVMVRDDADTGHFNINGGTGSGDGTATPSIGSTNVSMARETGGFFDSVNFDSTSYNRGWITFWYTAD